VSVLSSCSKDAFIQKQRVLSIVLKEDQLPSSVTIPIGDRYFEFTQPARSYDDLRPLSEAILAHEHRIVEALMREKDIAARKRLLQALMTPLVRAALAGVMPKQIRAELLRQLQLPEEYFQKGQQPSNLKKL